MLNKKNILLVALSLSTLLAFAQKELLVVNTFTPITWLGLDFSRTRFLGDYYNFNEVSKAQKLIKALNPLMEAERVKFDVAAMLHRIPSNIKYQMDVTNDHNSEIDLSSLLADSVGDSYHIQQSDIEQIVAGYDFKQNSGIGMMMNVEAFNKKAEKALIWITFINMDTKEMIMTCRVSGAPMGFGIRNFWAGAIYKVMKRVRQTEFDNWKRLYLSKKK